MTYTSKRKTHLGLKVFLWIVVILVIIGIAVKFFIYDPLKEKAVSALAEKLIQSEIASDTDATSDINAEEVLDSMSDEDKDTLNQLIDDNISADTISDVSSYLANGDTDGLKEYAKDTLSDDELQEVKDLYEKYKDELTTSSNE